MAHIIILIGFIIVIANIFFSFSLIFIERKDPSTTWAWLMIMIVLPGLGFIIYLLLGQNFSRARLFKEKKEFDTIKRRELSKDFTSKEHEHIGGEQYLDLIRMNYTHSGAKCTYNNEVDVYYNGVDKFAQLIKDLKNAKDDSIAAIEGKVEYNTDYFEFVSTTSSTGGQSGEKFNVTKVGKEGEVYAKLVLKVKENARGTGDVKFTELMASDGDMDKQKEMQKLQQTL